MDDCETIQPDTPIRFQANVWPMIKTARVAWNLHADDEFPPLYDHGFEALRFMPAAEFCQKHGVPFSHDNCEALLTG